MTRNSRRVLLLTGIFGLSLLSCGREVTGPGDGLPFGLSRVAALAIDPQFPRLPGTNLASDLVPFVRVRVTLRGLDGVVVKDTVVDFPSDADSVALTLDVPLPFTASDSGVPITLAMAFVNAAGDTVFRGGPAAITARPSGSAAASVPIVIPVAWVPPGAVPASVVMTPTTGTVVAGTSTVFSATAFDGGGAPIPGTPIDFSADTPSRASFAAPGSGTVTWLPNRGSVRIIASTLNLRADTSFFVVSLPASRLLAVSGGAQSAVIGTALAQPLVFRVTASDSVPVAGIAVTFAVTTGGGTLVALADTSDASGLVSTSWTLGSVVGAQSVTATATGIAGATQVVAATGLVPLPTQLAFAAAPTTGIAGATLASVVVEVRDANNARTPLFTGPVTLALNAGVTGATLGGTATVNAVAGIATFAGLSIQRAAAGLTLSATSGALTPATSAAFAITPAAPAILVAFAGDAQSGTLGQPLADSLAVELRDAFANPIAGATIAFSVTTGGGSVTPAGTVTNANGRARASWSLGALVGAQAARAQLVGAPAIFREFTATGAPGAPVRLEIVSEPSATQVAGAPFAPAIAVRAVDAVGATVTTFTGTIDLALGVNPSATTPTGTLATAAVAGIATFNNVVITATGVGYTLAATSGALLPDTTIAITVLNAAAAQLTRVSGNAQSGAVITALAAPFVVRVIDGFGNGVSGFAVNWSITSAGGALSATVTATDAGGFASTALTLPSVAGTATVQATAGGLAGSPQLFTATATAGTASQLAFTLNTGGGIAGAPITPGWVIQARDGLGNVVPNFTGAITVALTNGPPTAVLGGTTTVNAIAGVATFADLTVNLGASSWVLAATSPGLAGANSAAFSIGAAAPAQIALLSGNAQTAAVLAALTDSVAFRVTDQFGNFATGAPVTVAITVGGGSVSAVGGITDAAGRFATAWTLGTLLGAQSITATITTAPTAQAVATATATPGAAVALALVNTIGSQVAGATIPDLVVEARDASGNVATTFNGVVNGRVLTGPSGPDTDSVSVTAVNGVATFSGQTFETAGGYTLRFNAVGLTDVIHPTITVTPGAAANIAVVAGNAQTGAVSTTLTDSVTFRVTDTFGNGVPGTLLGIAVTSGGGVLAPSTGSTNAIGQLRTAWTLGSPLGLQSITATVAAAPAVQVVATATAIAGAATQLVMTSTPLGPQVAGIAFPNVVVQARDAAGNVATGFNGIVRAYVLGIAAVPFDSAAALAVAGVATFSGAFLEAAGTYSLRFTAPGLTDALGSAFVVTPAVAALLGPDGANSGNGQTAAILTTLANPLRARLTDTYLNPIAGVTVLFTATRGIDTLAVDTVVTNAQGIASITPSMPETAGPIQYLVSTTGLTGFTFNITAAVGAAANLTLNGSPTGGSVDAPIGVTGVTARDLGGNAVLAFTGNVTVTVDSGTVGALLAGTLTQAAVAGVATFADLRLDRPGLYRLRFTSAGLNNEITTFFTMTVGAPASLTVLEGNGQTGGALQLLPDSIGARVTDAFGNPIAGATVVWTVQAGGGSLAVASGITNVAGIARNAWTLGANIGTQSVRADAAGLTQVTFTATATATLANITWTGATSANWSAASNWSGGVVPTVSDSVRIPAGTPFAAAVDSQTFVVGRLLVENGATVVLDTFPLFVSGTLDVEAGAVVLGDSLGGFALIGNGTVRGAMPRLYVQNGVHTLNGPLALAGDLLISGGSLDVGTFATTVGGGLSTLGTGALVMTSAPGSITVQGDAIFAGGSTAGSLTAGVLTVRGDFFQGGGAADAFSASGAHVVDLDGIVTQLVTLLNPDASFTPSCGTGSCFATLRSLKSAGAGAIAFNSNAKATTRMQFTGDSVYASEQTLISGGTPDFQTAVTVASAIGWQTALTRGASFQVDTLIAWGTSAALIVGETIETRVLGEYQLVGPHLGAIIVDGANGVLDVTGAVSVGSGTGLALVTRGSGRVRMSQATDTLAVLGNADFGGVTVAGEMTNGVLELAGDFVMSNETDDAFIASGAHVTRFVNANPTVSFSRTGGNQFANVEITSASGFNFAGDATIASDVVLAPTVPTVGGGIGTVRIGGDLIDAIGGRWQVPLTQFDGADPQLPVSIGGSIVLTQGAVLDAALTVGGALTVSGGALDIGGRVLTVSGDLSTTGTGVLRMVNPADTVVAFNASFAGGDTDGLLTAGHLEILGGFSQAVTGGAFRAGPAHETWFVGALAANVAFATPGFGADSSHFGTLYLSQPSGISSFALSSDVYANGLLENGAVASGSDVAGSGQRIVSRGAEFSNIRFTNVRWQLVEGAAVTRVDSLSFLGMDPTAIAFEIQRAGGTIAIPNLTFAGYVPTAPGRYLRAEDTDGPTANGALTVNVTTPTPATNGGFLEVVNGAVVNGWFANPGFTWTGATNGDWLTASNWSDGVVPTGADSVHIPTGLATYPVVGSDTAVRVLTMDAGATLGHGGSDLTVRGSVDMAPTAAVTASSGVVRLTGSGAQTVRGSFNRLYLDGGDYALTGPVLTSGNVEVYNGDLSVGNFDLTIGGGILTGIGSTFTMTGTGTVDVASYVNFFGNSTAGRLTNGILRVRGDFEQLSGGGPEDLSFSASGNHVVELAGVGRQRVRFDSPDTTINGSCATSCFATLRSVQAPGTGWVEFSNGVKVLGDLDLQSDSVVALGTPAVGVRLVVAGTARFDTPVLRAGLIAWRDSVAQNASTALEVDSLVAWGSDTLLVGMPGVRTVVTGSYRLRGTIASSVDVRGALEIQGATRVIGAFSTSGSGTIAMSLVGDRLQVDSTATFGGGSTEGLLTGGTVRVGGNFFATSSAAYAASGAHGTVLYSGCGICDGYFVGLSDTLSTFRELEIESGSWTVNPPSAEVHILDNLSLLGTAQLGGTPLVRVGNNVNGDLGTNLASIRLSVAGAFDFAGTYVVDTLILAGASHVLTRVDPLGNLRNYNNVRVTGTATVVDDAIDGAQVLARLIVDGGTLRVGTVLSTDSARVFVNGVFETINGGVLEMRTPRGRLRTGNANFGGGSTAGLITAGLLSINGGDFTQSGDPESFVASGTHETRFSNEGAQQVTFANPGTGAGASRFQHLRIQQTAGSGLELFSDVVAAGQLRESMSAPAFVTAPIGTPFALTTGGARVVGIEFTRVRWVLGDGAPVDSTVAIRFNAMPGDVTQFDIIRGGGTVALQTLDFLTTPSTGLYLRATDGDVGNGIPLLVAVTSPTPVAHGGAIATAGGATITGWAQYPPLQAIVWTGALSTQWSNIGNWNLPRLPIATDSVYIDGSVLSGAGNPYVVQINVSSTVAKLIVGPSASLTLNHTLGQTLQIDSLASIPSNVTFNITSGSTLTGAADVNMGGFLNWNGGTLAGTGAMIIQPGGTADVATATSVTLNQRDLIIGGSADLGGSVIAGINSPTISVLSGGTLQLTASKSFVVSTGTVNLINAGTLRKAATAGLVIVEWPILNTGSIEVVDDTLDVQGLLSHAAGTLSIFSGAAVLARGESNFNGAVTVGSGGRLQLQSGGIGANAGNHIFSPTSSISGPGWLRINSADTTRIQGAMEIDSLTVQNGQTWFESASDTMFVTDAVYLGGGFFRGTGVIGVRGTFSTGGGNLNGTGTFAVLPSATLTLPTSVRGWNFDVANTGTIVWGDYGSFFEPEPVALTRPVMRIRNGGRLDIQHGTTSRQILGAGSATPPFDLIVVDAGGSIRKLTGTAESNLRPRILLSGNITILSGTLNVQGSCVVTSGTLTGTGLTGIASPTGGCVIP